jgi:hypothetical protein
MKMKGSKNSGETGERKELTPKIEEAVRRCAKRIAGAKDGQYFTELLTSLVLNHAIPVELLEHVPAPAGEVGKTRFDQLFDASMALVFPGYRRETLERLLGPTEERVGKIWRVLLPDRFQIAHVLIRARTFQEAFALGCDYACRASLRAFGKIPTDLTVRVSFMSERAIRRLLDIRWANRSSKRVQLKLIGREITDRQMNGARLIALGHPRSPKYSVVKYTERKDLDRVRKKKGLSRISSVEHESYERRGEGGDPAL